MSDEEKFRCFKDRLIRENRDQYGAELEERYDPGAVVRSEAWLSGLTQAQYQAMTTLEQEIRRKLAAAVRDGADPAGPAGREIAMAHQEWLSYSWSAADYTPQAHRGLAMMYTQDPRFTAYYDQALPGCAAFLSAAIQAHIH